MRCSEIFEGAIKLWAEVENGYDISDYTERFPYIIAMFCSEAEEVDRKYRIANDIEAMSYTFTPLTMSSEFPLCDALAASGIYYTAAMLVSDENMEASDRFFDKYCSSLSSIEAGLPGRVEQIKNVYFD